jgi:glycosyltransferase involved in cell wall biosynthesis
MRVAIVAPLVTPIAEPQRGGSQAVVADIAAGLTARGQDVAVFASSGSSIAGVNVVDTGVDSAALESSLFRAGSHGVQTTDESRSAFRTVYGLIAQGNYDVVHNHAFDAPAIELAANVTAPVVHTLHLGPDAVIVQALERAPRATVVCVSEWQRAAWGHVVDAVIRNGVPVDRIPWSPTAGEAALYAGRFSPEKGTREAVEIAIAAGRPIVAVGSAYDAEYADEIHARYGGRDDVEFRDALPRSELWSLMSRSRALLCPVLWDEPFGLTAAEAQAAGTPVIAFRRGALSEVVDDGVTGALVGDVAAAAAALQRTFDRRACRAHAERALSLDATLDAHEELYEQVVRRVRT